MVSLRCVAQFANGGDVTIEEDIQRASSASPSNDKEKERVAMSVSTHRKFVGGSELNPHNPVLHRVILATRGKSMVSYTTLVELLKAATCAAEGTNTIHF